MSKYRENTNVTSYLRKDDGAVMVSTDAYVSHQKRSGPYRSTFSMNDEDARRLRDELGVVLQVPSDADRIAQLERERDEARKLLARIGTHEWETIEPNDRDQLSDDWRAYIEEMETFANWATFDAGRIAQTLSMKAETSASQPITVRYTNHRGETATRHVTPTGAAYWGTTKWHPEPGWLLPVWDHKHQAQRDYALADCCFTKVRDEMLRENARSRLTSAGEKLDQALGEFIEFSDFETSHDPAGEKWVSMHASHWEALLSDARDARAAWSAVDQTEEDEKTPKKWPLDADRRWWVGEQDGNVFDADADWDGIAVTIEVKDTNEAKAVAGYFLWGDQ